MFIRIILAIVGFILFADGLYLLLQGKYHLGIILPFLIGIIFFIHAFLWKQIQAQLQKSLLLNKLWKMCWVVFFIWVLSLSAFFAYIAINKNKTYDKQDFKAMIVFGSGLIQGKASPTLQARLDKAAEVHQQSPEAYMVVTGGYGLGQIKSEAEVMSAYLQDNYSIAKESIILENQSTSTELNLANSQPLLKKLDIELSAPIALITSDFHTPRVAAIAKKQGYTNVTTYSAITPLETRYNAWLREYFAYISGWLLGEY